VKNSLALWKFCLALQSQNRKAQPGCSTTRSYARRNVKYLEIIAANLSKSRLELGLRRNRGLSGRTIWIADAHRDDGKRFVVRADEKLTAFLELERVTRDDDYRNQTIQKRLASVKGQALFAGGQRIASGTPNQ
jgi:hypothetical protein